MISDYKDIEYLEIKQSASDEIIQISRQKGFLEVCWNFVNQAFAELIRIGRPIAM